MSSNKNKYRKIVRGEPDNNFLKYCFENPSSYMTKTHVLIIRSVLRDRGIGT